MRSRRLRRYAAMAVLALTLVGCGASGGSGGPTGSVGESNRASAPGVTADTVTIGSHQPLTGVAAPGYSKIAPASEAFFRYLNDNGGVQGRKIVFRYEDDAYNPTQTAAVVRKLVFQDQVFAIFNGLGTPTHNAVVDFLNTARVPDVFVASGCPCWNAPDRHPYTFGLQTDYLTEGKILGHHVRRELAGKKVGYLAQNDDFGAGGVRGLDTQIDPASVVSRQTYQSGNTNIGPQIAALKAAGADVVVAFTTPSYTALAKLAALQIGYDPQFVVSNVGSDLPTLTTLVANFSRGARPSAILDGLVSDSMWPALGDDQNGWNRLFRRVNETYNGNAVYDQNVLYGMASAYVFAKALQAAGRNPTRDGLVQAVETANLAGPGTVPLRFSRTDHSGYAGARMTRVRGGAATGFGPAYATDPGSGPIEEYHTPQPEPPARGLG